MYTPAVFAKRVGVSVKTLQKWDRTLVLPAKRTITNRRYYTDEDLAAALRLPRVQKERRTVAYCRVSSQAQKPDRKSTRLNSSHTVISYAVFCLKKKKT